MHITTSAVQMNSARYYKENRVNYSIASTWNVLTGVYDSTEELEDASLEEGEKTAKQDNEPSFEQRLEETRAMMGVKPVGTTEDLHTSIRKMKQQMLDYLLYLLFGKKVPEDMLKCEETDLEAVGTAQPLQIVNNGQGGAYESYFYYSENEQVAFDTKATVKTADGRSIDVAMTVELSRSFVEETSSYIEYGQPLVCDPLIINLNCKSANLTAQKFLFDLDSDGKEESISMATSGSGFLAYDKNGDGIINDGSELFGTKSGNGFEDLRVHDKDGNGWIDEADEIFSKLKVWSKDEFGNDSLMSLKDAGVGAIYLGSADTQFSITNDDNSVNAYIRRSGLFLYENGLSSTVQQVDLVTDEKV